MEPTPAMVTEAQERVKSAFDQAFVSETTPEGEAIETRLDEFLLRWNDCVGEIALLNVFLVCGGTHGSDSVLQMLQRIHQTLALFAGNLLLMSRPLNAKRFVASLVGYVEKVNELSATPPDWIAFVDTQQKEQAFLRTNNFVLSIMQKAMLRPRQSDPVEAMLLQIGVDEEAMYDSFQKHYSEVIKSVAKAGGDKISILEQVHWPISLAHPPGSVPHDHHFHRIEPEKIVLRMLQYIHECPHSRNEELFSKYPELSTIASSPALHLRFFTFCANVFLKTGNIVITRLLTLMGEQLSNQMLTEKKFMTHQFYPSLVRELAIKLSLTGDMRNESAHERLVAFLTQEINRLIVSMEGREDPLKSNFKLCIVFSLLWEWPTPFRQALLKDSPSEDCVKYVIFMIHPGIHTMKRSNQHRGYFQLPFSKASMSQLDEAVRSPEKIASVIILGRFIHQYLGKKLPKNEMKQMVCSDIVKSWFSDIMVVGLEMI